jgi:hypothetical protein
MLSSLLGLKAVVAQVVVDVQITSLNRSRSWVVAACLHNGRVVDFDQFDAPNFVNLDSLCPSREAQVPLM